MKIKDVLQESTSLESTLTAIINDIGTPVANVFANLRHAIQRAADNNGLDKHGRIRGIGLIVGGEASRWREVYYSGRLKGELFDLIKYKPNITTELKSFLSKEDTVSISATDLPDLLMQVARRLNNKQLYMNAERWKNEQEGLSRFITKVTKEASDYENRGLPTSDDEPPKPDKSDAEMAGYAKQNAQVEQIVNDVLGKINKDDAGQIRNAISRSGNKLLALQQELAKRKIVVKEAKALVNIL